MPIFSIFQNNKYSRIFKISIHLSIWLLLSLLPFLLSFSDAPDFVRVARLVWLPMVLYAVIFYLNYGMLIEKLLFQKKIIGFIFINLFLGLLFTWINNEIREFLNMITGIQAYRTIRTYPPLPQSWYLYKDFLAMLIPVIVSIATKATENWTKIAAEKKEREKEILNSELQHLKYQLQPHFFFNSLNTVYALIERSPEQAQEVVHNLSKLMRYLLYETDNGMAKLSDEIEFMSKYINLMKLRISDKNSVKINFDLATGNLSLTPLLFISLIENAFKHGISATQSSEIIFNFSCKDKTVKFHTQNTNFPKNENDKSGSGIGLINLKKRLELCYPGKYTFSTQTTDTLFVASLEIITD